MGQESACPEASYWKVMKTAVDGDRLVLHLMPVRAGVACPLCGVRSRRIHSRYRRRALDLPWFSWPVQLIIQARRFFCDSPECERRIFVEPFPKALGRYARQTQRNRDSLLELAHCSSAEMAARVARLLGFVASPDSLIRLQRLERFPAVFPRVLGVDEFALRKGRSYGTLMVDLERRLPVDTFEGIAAKDLTAWLRNHPQVEVLARDRAWAYRLAGQTALPEAQQVADRFHLVQNVSLALKDLLHSRRWQQPESFGESAAASPESRATRSKRGHWEAVRDLKDSGLSLSAIARKLGLNRKTVAKYMASDQPPEYAGRPPGNSKVRPYLHHLRRRWIEGCRSARTLYREVVELGYTGSERHIRKAVQPWRNGAGRPGKSSPPLKWLVLRPRGRLKSSEQNDLDRFLQANPPLALGHQLKEWFHEVLSKGDLETLDAWVHEASRSEMKQFKSVARSFQQDYEAIKLALTSPWSTGQCEGQICRVKLIKRVGYGRAKPDLLRQRILHRCAA